MLHEDLRLTATREGNSPAKLIRAPLAIEKIPIMFVTRSTEKHQDFPSFPTISDGH
jgi:hypothetical protein